MVAREPRVVEREAEKGRGVSCSPIYRLYSTCSIRIDSKEYMSRSVFLFSSLGRKMRY